MAPHVKSKRTTLKHKHKVEKKVRQHQRSVRRANRHKPEVRKIKKKDPGIPNLWPFKQQMLEQMERKKVQDMEKKKASQEAHREAIRAARQAGVDHATAQLMADAARRQVEFERRNALSNDAEPFPDTPHSTQDSSKRAFMKEFQKVIESSDVILEVIDARDPIGCRCYSAEKAIVASSGGAKRIVLVLNKVDMVPKDVADKWLAYLRNEFPTVPFRASVQKTKGKGQANMSALAASSVNTSECLGASNLLALLKNYSRSRNLKTSITVGVIGYPNVGKSSLINSLKRTRAVAAGSTPGLTRSSQEVHLDKNIRLIDCPGIVFSADQADALVLRNCMKIEQLNDPISPVETILKRVGQTPLMVAYKVPAFDNVTEFLAFLCSTLGKYKKGGSYDIEAAARIVLQDWNSGKIPFYTLPPKGPSQSHVSAAIVAQWGKEFDVEAVTEQESKQLDALAALSHDKRSYARAEPSRPLTANGEIGTRTDAKLAQKTGKGSDGSQPTFHVAEQSSDRKRTVDGRAATSPDTMELE